MRARAPRAGRTKGREHPSDGAITNVAPVAAIAARELAERVNRYFFSASGFTLFASMLIDT